MAAIGAVLRLGAGRLAVSARRRARGGGADWRGVGAEIVYGGGKVGLMGLVADAAMAEGGRVIGVMPRSLVEAEISHPGLSALHVVESMHERKTRMSELSDGFLTLPGGPGTFEEIFEQWTWALLGFHAKPCAFLEVGGYFDPLRAMIDNMVGAAFLSEAHRDMLVFAPDVDAVLARFVTYVAPTRKYAPGVMTEIRTARLRLRRARPDDLEALHAILSDPAAMRYWSSLPHESLDQTRDWLGNMISAGRRTPATTGSSSWMVA